MTQIFFFIIIISSSVRVKSEFLFEEKVQNAGVEFIKSFLNFKDNVSRFFHIDTEKINRMKKTVQNVVLKLLEKVVDSELVKIPAIGHHSSIVTSDLKEKVEPELSSFALMVKADGYDSETHIIVTKDGYVLTLYRIFSETIDASNRKHGVVLLHHGILGSADDWILLGPRKALPYLLINAGYEVWLANARGNKYSRNHVTKPVMTDGFWSFSFHEMGLFDLPAVIDYISEKNNSSKKINFIGHSLGATALIILLSTFPQYNHILRSAVLMAPLAFMHEVKGPLRLVAQFYDKLNFSSLRFLQNREFKMIEAVQTKLIEKFCKRDTNLCRNPLLLLANNAQEPSEEIIRSKIIKHTPGGGSMKTIIHYIQLIKSSNFAMFDMGDEILNLEKYSSDTPPSYRLGDVTLPLAIISSSDDWMATVPDIKKLLQNLRMPVKHHVLHASEFNHMDFLWANSADIYVYYIILDFLKDQKAGDIV